RACWTPLPAVACRRRRTPTLQRAPSRRSLSCPTRIRDLPRTSIWRWLAEAAGMLLSVASPAIAQDTLATPPYTHAVWTWIALIAAPGYERLATDRIMSASAGWTRDDMGNLVKHAGTGAPRRAVACGIDETGYVVSEITDDGYLRVHG